MKYYKCNSYKYQLAEDYKTLLDINSNAVDFDKIFDFVKIEPSDDSIVFIVKKGYAWDGASGPTIDTKDSMVASLVHDAMYQCIRLGVFSRNYKKEADKIFYNNLVKSGMNKVRAYLWYLGVKFFGGSSCKPGKLQSKEIIKIAD